MRYFKYLALLAILAIPTAYASAQVAVGVQIGPTYGLYNAPPVCTYGYYAYYPYACAPVGYWGPQWFVGGVFIGAGPWYHFYYTHPALWHGYYGRFYGRPAVVGAPFRSGPVFHGPAPAFRADNRGFARVDRGFRGGGRAVRR
jgi:hypothetical protein